MTSWTTRTMPKRRRSSCDSWRPAWRRQPRRKGTKGKEGLFWIDECNFGNVIPCKGGNSLKFEGGLTFWNLMFWWTVLEFPWFYKLFLANNSWFFVAPLHAVPSQLSCNMTPFGLTTNEFFVLPPTPHKKDWPHWRIHQDVLTFTIQPKSCFGCYFACDVLNRYLVTSWHFSPFEAPSTFNL